MNERGGERGGGYNRRDFDRRRGDRRQTSRADHYRRRQASGNGYGNGYDNGNSEVENVENEQNLQERQLAQELVKEANLPQQQARDVARRVTGDGRPAKLQIQELARILAKGRSPTPEITNLAQRIVINSYAGIAESVPLPPPPQTPQVQNQQQSPQQPPQAQKQQQSPQAQKQQQSPQAQKQQQSPQRNNAAAAEQQQQPNAAPKRNAPVTDVLGLDPATSTFAQLQQAYESRKKLAANKQNQNMSNAVTRAFETVKTDVARRDVARLIGELKKEYGTLRTGVMREKSVTNGNQKQALRKNLDAIEESVKKNLVTAKSIVLMFPEFQPFSTQLELIQKQVDGVRTGSNTGPGNRQLLNRLGAQTGRATSLVGRSLRLPNQRAVSPVRFSNDSVLGRRQPGKFELKKNAQPSSATPPLVTVPALVGGPAALRIRR
jgi:outer membrane biosynthesis protein TonB